MSRENKIQNDARHFHEIGLTSSRAPHIPIESTFKTLWVGAMLEMLGEIVLENGKEFEIMDYAYFQRGDFIVMTYDQTDDFPVGERTNVLYITHENANSPQVEIWNYERKCLLVNMVG